MDGVSKGPLKGQSPDYGENQSPAIKSRPSEYGDVFLAESAPPPRFKLPNLGMNDMSLDICSVAD